ncbi:hypothetical protein [Stigmatella hybrida]|uniref:hypothetical protein n=1 Tax=Stigmatella hybrida TaxID=394097 RepID=UPI001CDA9BD1|nr:hypothetical protein [Stigmatella hybrida]
MTEKPKRLAPTGDTLRELYLKSGNLCAYPGCTEMMMNLEGVFIGQVCHIEAAEEGGQRFNPAMTNEERRAASNLMLMCYPHHKVTDNVAKYPVETLRSYKADHERRFADPVRAIQEKLTDWTTMVQPKGVKNLRRIDSVLGWGQSDEELQEMVQWVNEYIEDLTVVPLDVRQFLGAVVQRVHRVKGTQAARTGLGTALLTSDLKSALQIPDRVINDRINQLEAYNLGGLTELDGGTQWAVSIREVHGWPLWLDIVAFCKKAPESFDAFILDLDFSRLDD